MLAAWLGLPRQAEILIIIFLGICFLSLDFSLFHVKENLEAIWQIELDKTKYLEIWVKYVISAVVLVRTFTLHAFLAFYVVMLWPAIFEEKPNLMLPWLLLGIIRCLILNAITFIIGTFICQKEKGLSPICFEYILTQIIEHGPSVYAWMAALSFYREIAGETSSQQSSSESLRPVQQYSLESQDSGDITKDSEDAALNRARSYSLSDLNMDYSHSSKSRSLPANMSIEVLRDLLAEKIMLRDGSKSSDPVSEILNGVDLSSPNAELTIYEKTLKTLEISSEEFMETKKKRGRFVEELQDVSVDDLKRVDFAKSFYISRGRLHKGEKTHIPQSQSESGQVEVTETCLCFIKRQLQLEQSNQTLLETEIANITFNGTEDAKAADENALPKVCNAIKSTNNDHLNRHRVVGGSGFGFNPNVFLRKFVLKKNTSKNFGCQVAVLRRGFLEESRSQLIKKLMFLRHLS